MDYINWNELVGKRILVKSHPAQMEVWDVIVSKYENGLVTFDDDRVSYPESQLVLIEVFEFFKYCGNMEAWPSGKATVC